MSQETLNQFFKDILQDEALQERLSDAQDLESFVAIALELSKEKGYGFTEAELITDIETVENQNDVVLLTEEELEQMGDNSKPWKRLVSQLKWARGRNYEIWSKIQKMNQSSP